MEKKTIDKIRYHWSAFERCIPEEENRYQEVSGVGIVSQMKKFIVYLTVEWYS